MEQFEELVEKKKKEQTCCQKALSFFTDPEPYSRSKDHQAGVGSFDKD